LAPRARTLGDLLEETAERRGEALGLADETTELTWSDAALRARRISDGLRRLGVGRGDRVAVMMGNRVEWVLCDFAVARLGALFMGLNTWYLEPDLGYVLAKSGATVAICSADEEGTRFHELIAAIRPGCPELEHVIVLGAEDRLPASALSFQDLEASGDPSSGTDAVSPDDAANILYTSGTTAAPKGVVLHHGRLIENGFAIGERQHLDPDDVLGAVIPMFFSFFSANALMAVMSHFGAIVSQGRFDAGRALDLVEKRRCTVYYGMPNMTQALLEEQQRRPRNLRSLRKGLTIGSPETINDAARLVSGICNIYGLTETYGNCAVCDADDPLETKMVTQGRLLPAFTMKVVDPETGRRQPAGVPGLMCVKGNVTSGYFRDPQTTTAAFDAEGFFITGDIGALGEDGRVRYLGRLKEMIKTGGINVSPVQIEDVLLGHPAVRQAFVVPAPDPIKDEVPVAFVEMQPGEDQNSDGLIDYARAALPAYAVPKRVIFVTEADLPRTATGKVQKTQLARRLRAEQTAP
jgi:fatty-acyl-CoA synthase